MRILESIQLVDHKLFIACFQGKMRLKKYAAHVSKSGDGYLYFGLPILYLLLSPELGGAFFLFAACAFAIERSLYYVLKNKLKRKRPPEAIPGFRSLVEASDEFSFPSGHTSAAFLFGTLCVLWFGIIALPLYLWAISVGFSRILLGVHFPTDIFAGAIIGLSVAFSVAAFVL